MGHKYCFFESVKSVKISLRGIDLILQVTAWIETEMKNQSVMQVVEKSMKNSHANI